MGVATTDYRIVEQKSVAELTEQTIRKSVFFEPYRIEERVSNLHLIETMLTSDSITYLINPNIYRQFFEIRADYLCRYEKTKADIFYLFSVIVRSFVKFANECHGCSFFEKYERDYTRGCAVTMTLMIQRISNKGKEDEMVETVYTNKAYKE